MRMSFWPIEDRSRMSLNSKSLSSHDLPRAFLMAWMTSRCSHQTASCDRGNIDNQTIDKQSDANGHLASRSIRLCVLRAHRELYTMFLKQTWHNLHQFIYLHTNYNFYLIYRMLQISSKKSLIATPPPHLTLVSRWYSILQLTSQQQFFCNYCSFVTFLAFVKLWILSHLCIHVSSWRWFLLLLLQNFRNSQNKLRNIPLVEYSETLLKAKTLST